MPVIKSNQVVMPVGGRFRGSDPEDKGGAKPAVRNLEETRQWLATLPEDSSLYQRVQHALLTPGLHTVIGANNEDCKVYTISNDERLLGGADPIERVIKQNIKAGKKEVVLAFGAPSHEQVIRIVGVEGQDEKNPIPYTQQLVEAGEAFSAAEEKKWEAGIDGDLSVKSHLGEATLKKLGVASSSSKSSEVKSNRQILLVHVNVEKSGTSLNPFKKGKVVEVPFIVEYQKKAAAPEERVIQSKLVEAILGDYANATKDIVVRAGEMPGLREHVDAIKVIRAQIGDHATSGGDLIVSADLPPIMQEKQSNIWARVQIIRKELREISKDLSELDDSVKEKFELRKSSGDDFEKEFYEIDIKDLRERKTDLQARQKTNDQGVQELIDLFKRVGKSKEGKEVGEGEPSGGGVA